MRIRHALTVGAALLALTTVAGCDDGDDKASGGGGKGTSATPTPTASPSAAAESPSGDSGDSGTTEQALDGGLPETRGDAASIVNYLSLYTTCENVQSGEEYDSTHDSSDAAWGSQEATDPSWAIKERAVCTDASSYPIALLTVSDMTKFETAAKAGGDVFAIGENFAVVPVGDASIEALSKSEMAFLTCDPDFSPPSGYRTEPALVDGCVVSDYWLT